MFWDFLNLLPAGDSNSDDRKPFILFCITFSLHYPVLYYVYLHKCRHHNEYSENSDEQGNIVSRYVSPKQVLEAFFHVHVNNLQSCHTETGSKHSSVFKWEAALMWNQRFTLEKKRKQWQHDTLRSHDWHCTSWDTNFAHLYITRNRHQRKRELTSYTEVREWDVRVMCLTDVEVERGNMLPARSTLLKYVFEKIEP